MLVLIGRAASGKDTVQNILINKFGFRKLVPYTTRPMRNGEIQDDTYHYITQDDFIRKVEEGFFAEYRMYDVNGDIWYYGSSNEDVNNADNNTVYILPPDGVRSLQKRNLDQVVIYLYVNLRTTKNRLKSRNDKNDTMNERIQRDNADFKNAELLADKIVYNNEDVNIDDVAERVFTQYKKCLELKERR